MTRQEIHARFIRIVSAALAKPVSKDAPVRWYRWEHQAPSINGQFMPASSNYNGDISLPGNLDGRSGKRGVN